MRRKLSWLYNAIGKVNKAKTKSANAKNQVH